MINIKAFACVLLAGSFSTAVLGIDFEARRIELRKKYAYLYQEKVRTNPDGSLGFHKGTLFKREGINVLHLKGDQVEMAFQHGKLLKEEIKQGAIAYSSELVRNNVRASVGDRPIIVNVASNFIHRQHTQTLIDNAFKLSGNLTVADVMISLSETTDITIDNILKALFNPETLYILAGNTIHSGGDDVIITPPGNCSAFVVWDEFSKDGGIIFGRNTDFPINGYYDRFPTVIYFEPTDGTLKYMIVSSSGAHSAGVMGINEAGIMFSSHTIPTDEVSSEAVPVFMTANMVAALASTFDEAVDLFKKYKSGSGWSYDIISTKERRIGSVDISNKHVAVRESKGGIHVQTNQYLAPEMIKHQTSFNKGVDQDAAARYMRIEDMLRSNKGNIDERFAARILGDHLDPISGVERSFPNTVSVHTTVSSFVALPDQGKIFVANGMAPVSENTYVEFPLINNFDVQTFAQQDYQKFENDYFKREYPEKAKGEQFFISAKKSYDNAADFAKSLAFMKQAMAVDPENPGYQFEGAILALKTKDYAFAKKLLVELVKRPLSHIRLLSNYYLARVYAAEANHRQAEAQLKIVLAEESAGKKLATAAQNILNQISGRRNGLPIKDSALKLMVQQADLMAYE
jgi:hypothetical protein